MKGGKCSSKHIGRHLLQWRTTGLCKTASFHAFKLLYTTSDWSFRQDGNLYRRTNRMATSESSQCGIDYQSSEIWIHRRINKIEIINLNNKDYDTNHTWIPNRKHYLLFLYPHIHLSGSHRYWTLGKRNRLNLPVRTTQFINTPNSFTCNFGGNFT